MQKNINISVNSLVHNIVLRQWTIDDCDAFAKLCDTVDDTYDDHFVSKPCSEYEAWNWISNMIEIESCCGGLYRAIVADGDIVGLISVTVQSGNHSIDGSIGFIMMPEACGKGIATKAVALMAEEAFRLMSIERLSAVVYEPNKASARVLEKNGFILEGRKARAVRSKGIIYDTLLFGLLFKDWVKNNPELQM